MILSENSNYILNTLIKKKYVKEISYYLKWKCERASFKTT